MTLILNNLPHCPYTFMQESLIIQAMTLVLLHNLDGDEVLVNTKALNAASRKFPDADSMIKEPFTKLYYIEKDKGMSLQDPVLRRGDDIVDGFG